MSISNLDRNDLGNLTKSAGSTLRGLINRKKSIPSLQFQDVTEKVRESALTAEKIFNLFKSFLPEATPLDLLPISTGKKEKEKLLSSILAASEQCKQQHGRTTEALIEKTEIPILPYHDDNEFESCFFDLSPNFAVVINPRKSDEKVHFSLLSELGRYLFSSTHQKIKVSAIEKIRKISQGNAEQTVYIARKFAEFFAFEFKALEKVSQSMVSNFDEAFAQQMIESAQVSPDILKRAICNLLEIQGGSFPEEELLQKIDHNISLLSPVESLRMEELIHKCKNQFRDILHKYNRKFSEENFDLFNAQLRLGIPRF